MIRKFNYTNRKKVPRENVNIKLNKSGDRTFFNAEIFKDGLSFPDNSRIYIESFYGPDLLRFDFGTFGDIKQPSNTDITEIKQLSDNVYFHLKVVDESAENGLLLGDIKIYDLTDDQNIKGRTSIFYVNPVKMNTNEIWRINFRANEGMPLLEVNKDIEGIFEIAKSDPVFISLVYPSAIRQILTHIVTELENLDYEGDDWSCKWILFTRITLGILNTPNDPSDEVACEEWIESVVRAFSLKHRLFENYVNKIKA